MAARVDPEDWKPQGVDDLEEAADEAVRSTRCSLVIAGPGSGKTELLAQRACYLLQTGLCPPPERILAVSFKRDAARNLEERVHRRCGEELARRFHSSTFEAFAKGMMDRFGQALPREWKPRTDYKLDFKLKRDTYRDTVGAIPAEFSDLSRAEIAQIQDAEYETWFAGRRLSDMHAKPKSREERAASALWRYYLHGGETSTLSFAMIGRLAEHILVTNPKILLAMRATYSFVFLDEFQDTTDIQYSLTHTAFHGSASVLTAVGDNKQSIMRFAHALANVFDRFEEEFDADVYRLKNNYRSAPKLVEIIGHLAQAIDEDAPTPIAMDDGSHGQGDCRLLLFRDHEEEAEYIAELIRGWVHDDKVPPRDICIITRQFPDSYTAALREALESKGISARVEERLQALLTEPAVMAVLNLVKLASREQDSDAWEESLRLMLTIDGATTDIESKRTAKKLSAFVAELRKVIEQASRDEPGVKTVIVSILGFLSREAVVALYPQYGQGTFLSDLLKDTMKTLADCLADHDWSEAVSQFEGDDSVPIMTTHKSKGLEYYAVVFVGLEDYPFRHFKSLADDEAASFFVSLSRAEKHVVFTFAGTRLTVNGSRRAQARETVKPLYELLEAAGVTPETPVA